MEKFRIEAITVCIDYSDFLAVTVVQNRRMFDYMLVVTSKADKATQNLCRAYNIDCLATDVFYKDCKPTDKRIPNKALGINEGLRHLHKVSLTKNKWLLQIDADIWLPPMTRHILEKLWYRGALDEKKIYGCDRLMCKSYEAWEQFIYSDNNDIHSKWYLINMDQFPVGHRVVHYGDTGYEPIGFFQLWHQHSGITSYPEYVSGYDRTDVLHAKQWEPINRGFLPEIVVVHLESEPGHMGQNWNGRKSAPFKPKCRDLFSDNEYCHKPTERLSQTTF